MLPDRVRLSQRATDKLRYLKSQIGVTPNILARVAIMLAIRDGESLKTSENVEFDGVELNKSTLFGDSALVYEALIKQYIIDNSIEMPMTKVISVMIDIGTYKISHVRALPELFEFID